MTSKLFFILAFPMVASAATQGGDLNIEIENLKSGAGKVYVALYTDPAVFPKQGKEAFAQIVESSTDRVTAVFKGVAPGKYAVAIFQDLNKNGLLDKGLFGSPKEPFGFSNDAKPRLAPPDFKDALIVHGEDAQVIKIKMQMP